VQQQEYMCTVDEWSELYGAEINICVLFMECFCSICGTYQTQTSEMHASAAL
jgi:hypothetical protein